MGTKIIKLEQKAAAGVGKGPGSTDFSHSQITSPITQPKIPALPALHQHLDSNLNSISNTFRKEVAERAGTSAQNTGREGKELAMANAVRASMSKKSGESHRDRLNTLNLDLDIPTSSIIQKAQEGGMKAMASDPQSPGSPDKTRSGSSKAHNGI